jgi:hypothetical protein
MKTSSELSAELDHAHLVMDREKRMMTVLRRDGVTIVAVREGMYESIYLTTYDPFGIPVGSVWLPYEAFDEILEMLICMDRSDSVRILPPEPEGVANGDKT